MSLGARRRARGDGPPPHSRRSPGERPISSATRRSRYAHGDGHSGQEPLQLSYDVYGDLSWIVPLPANDSPTHGLGTWPP